MDWTHLASAAIGGLLTLLIKEGIEWLRTERRHRLELRSRHFDAKLDATIRVIREIKTTMINVRAFTKFMKENDDSDGWIHPGLHDLIWNSFGNAIQRVNQESAGWVALLGFYYDDEVAELANFYSGIPTPLIQKLSEFMWRVDETQKARTLLNQTTIPLPDDVKKTAEVTIAFHDKEMRMNIGELSKLGDALDERANRIVRRMREDYKTIRF